MTKHEFQIPKASRVMLFDVDIEQWLSERSTDVRRIGSELHFTHLDKPVGVSVLIEHPRHLEAPCVNVRTPELAAFYGRFLGGSLFGGMLMIASPMKGGVQLSEGFRLPDLDEAKQFARDYEFSIGDDTDVFLISSAWTFLYSPGKSPTAPLICYDRDFRTISEDRSFSQVLSEMWTIVNEA
jgi:hypothetical protein